MFVSSQVMLKYNGGSIIFHNFNRDASGTEILNILRDLWIGFSESLLPLAYMCKFDLMREIVCVERAFR